MTENSRQILHTLITMILADNQVDRPQVVASRITEAVIASGLTTEKEWSE